MVLLSDVLYECIPTHSSVLRNITVSQALENLSCLSKLQTLTADILQLLSPVAGKLLV